MPGCHEADRGTISAPVYNDAFAGLVVCAAEAHELPQGRLCGKRAREGDASGLADGDDGEEAARVVDEDLADRLLGDPA